jgi:hypothetical protein
MSYCRTGQDDVKSEPNQGIGNQVSVPLFISGMSRVLPRFTPPMGQDGHACMASAETSRNSFSVAPLAD